MKIYELEETFDAQRDGLRILRNMKKRNNLNENAQEQVNNFMSAMGGYNIEQSQLVLGSTYCPIDFIHDSAENKVALILVVSPTEYVGEKNGRLLFKYPNTNTVIQFPADGHTSNNDIRIVAKDKSQLDTIVQQFTLQFDKDVWNVDVHGYSPIDGAIRRITNI